MAEAQLTNAASLADSPVFKRSRGRPKKDDTQRRPIPPPAFLQKEKRPRGRPRIHPPKDPSAVKRPRGRPKVNPDGAPRVVKPPSERVEEKSSQSKIQQLQLELQAKDEEIAALKRKLEELESILQQNTAVKATNGTPQPPVYVKMPNDESLQHVRFLTMPPPAPEDTYVMKDASMEDMEEDAEEEDETSSTSSESVHYQHKNSDSMRVEEYEDNVHMGSQRAGNHGNAIMPQYSMHRQHQQHVMRRHLKHSPTVPSHHTNDSRANENRFQQSSTGRHGHSVEQLPSNHKYIAALGNQQQQQQQHSVSQARAHPGMVGDCPLQNQAVEDLYTNKYIPRGVHFPHQPVKYNSAT